MKPPRRKGAFRLDDLPRGPTREAVAKELGLCPGCESRDGRGRRAGCQQGCPISYLQPVDMLSPANPPKPPTPEKPRMTRLEQRYQAFLEEEQRVGRIALWKREPFRFVIESGKRFSYLPDFGVVYADRGMSLIECKPRDKKNGKALWIYEDSRVKTKAVAAAFRGWPWKLIVTWPLRDGTWGREEL